MIDERQHGLIVFLPFDNRINDGGAHIAGQRVQRLGPVQNDPTDAAFFADDHIAHCLSMSRAMMTRMISLVPSRMQWTRRSR